MSPAARSCCPTIHGLQTALRIVAPPPPPKKLELARTLCEPLNCGCEPDPLASLRCFMSPDVRGAANAGERPLSATAIVERMSSSSYVVAAVPLKRSELRRGIGLVEERRAAATTGDEAAGLVEPVSVRLANQLECAIGGINGVTAVAFTSCQYSFSAPPKRKSRRLTSIEEQVRGGVVSTDFAALLAQTRNLHFIRLLAAAAPLIAQASLVVDVPGFIRRPTTIQSLDESSDFERRGGLQAGPDATQAREEVRAPRCRLRSCAGRGRRFAGRC